MLESMKAFLTIQRHNAMLPNVGWCEDVKMQFENNRIIAEKYFGKTLGILKEGAAADIIIMDYKPFTPFSDENIDGHMIFGMEGKNCRTTTSLSKDYGLSAEKLNSILHGLKIQYKTSDGQWVLYTKYCGKGYTKNRKSTPFQHCRHQRLLQHGSSNWSLLQSKSRGKQQHCCRKWVQKQSQGLRWVLFGSDRVRR